MRYCGILLENENIMMQFSHVSHVLAVCSSTRAGMNVFMCSELISKQPYEEVHYKNIDLQPVL